MKCCREFITAVAAESAPPQFPKYKYTRASNANAAHLVALVGSPLENEKSAASKLLCVVQISCDLSHKYRLH